MMAADNVGVITIADVIDSCWGFNSKTFNRALADLKTQGATSLKLAINSGGGDVIEALAIYDTIRASGLPTTSEVCGLCASAATIIALACDQVTMTANSTWMTHEPTMCSIGTLAQIRSDLTLISNLRDRIYAIYARKTGKDVESLQADCSVDYWLSAQGARDYGYVDAVTGEDEEPEDEEPEDEEPEDEGAAADPPAEDDETPPADEGEPPAKDDDDDRPPVRGLYGPHAGLLVAARRGLAVLTPAADAANADELRALRAQVGGLRRQLASALGRVNELTQGSAAPSVKAVVAAALTVEQAGALPAPQPNAPTAKDDPERVLAQDGWGGLIEATLAKRI